MITDFLTYPFIQNAVLMSLLMSIICGLLGAYIVVQKQSFLSGSVAHASFGGIGISLLLGLNPFLCALGFSAAIALLMGWIKEHYAQQMDSLIGAVWAVGMAKGIILVHLATGYAADMLHFLFGNILLTQPQDLVYGLSLLLIVLTLVWRFYDIFRAITFDHDYAKTLNIAVFKYSQLLLVMISATIVILIHSVGVILVIAFLTLPAASARNLTSNLPKLQALAILVSLLSSLSGLALSLSYDIPTGPMMVIVAAVIYILSWLKK